MKAENFNQLPTGDTIVHEAWSEVTRLQSGDDVARELEARCRGEAITQDLLLEEILHPGRHGADVEAQLDQAARPVRNLVVAAERAAAAGPDFALDIASAPPWTSRAIRGVSNQLPELIGMMRRRTETYLTALAERERLNAVAAGGVDISLQKSENQQLLQREGHKDAVRAFEYVITLLEHANNGLEGVPTLHPVPKALELAHAVGLSFSIRSIGAFQKATTFLQIPEAEADNFIVRHDADILAYVERERASRGANAVTPEMREAARRNFLGDHADEVRAAITKTQSDIRNDLAREGVTETDIESVYDATRGFGLRLAYLDRKRAEERTTPPPEAAA